MERQIMTIILADGEHVDRPMPIGVVREIEDIMRYGVFTEIGTTKIWYPPSQVIKISYPNN